MEMVKLLINDGKANVKIINSDLKRPIALARTE